MRQETIITRRPVKPVFVPCASGINRHTECMVGIREGKVRITGYAEMDFDPVSAAALALAIMAAREGI